MRMERVWSGQVDTFILELSLCSYAQSLQLLFVIYNLDPNMILSAMVPAATVQIDASLWLQTYFEQFGDVSPNSLLTHVSQGSMTLKHT